MNIPPATNWLRSAGSLLPGRSDYAGLGRTWRGDLLAGLTVAVVALPLALAFGVASGMGAAAGLVTAIVAGAVAAVFGGSNFQVSGPTGAMTVILLPIVMSQGSSSAITIAVLAGVIVAIMGITGLGKLVTLIPWPVIEGFTLGIAIIIGLQQVPNALGVPSGDSDKTVINTWEAFTHLSANSVPVLIITAMTILIIVALQRIRRSLPSTLIAVVAASLVTAVVGIAVPTVGAIPNHLPTPTLPNLSPDAITALFSSALAVAVLAAIESLLSAKVADGMVDTPPSSPNRELFGQGLANIASGIFGGMPATGAIARTAVNIRAGASSRLSSLTHSAVLLLIVMFASTWVSAIPLAALAGVLLATCYRMVDPRAVRTILRTPGLDKLVFALTAIATVVFDLIVAVEIGIALAAVLALMSLARNSQAEQEPFPDLADHVDSSVEHQLLSEHIAIYRIDGSIFFGAAQRFLDELSAISDVRVVILRMSGVAVLDTTGANALRCVVDDLTGRKITVIFKGLRPEHERLLTTVGAIRTAGPHEHNYRSLDEAIVHARSHVLIGG